MLNVILEVLGMTLPRLIWWFSLTTFLSSVGAAVNAWYGSLDWVTFSLLCICLGLALSFFLIHRPALLFLVASALVGAAWTHGEHKGEAVGKREGVRAIQELLGVFPDGYVGKDTEAALQKLKDGTSAQDSQIKQLQTALGVDADGIIGSVTIARAAALKRRPATCALPKDKP